MDLLPNEDQVDVARTVAEFVRRQDLGGRVLESRGAPFRLSEHEWRGVADVGLIGMAIAEADGGVGFGLVEEVLAFRELGRGVAPGPILPTVLAARLAVAAEAPALAASLIAGDRRAGLVVAAPAGEDGAAPLLLDAADADLLLRVTPKGAALYDAVEVAGHRAALEPLDPSCTLERAAWTDAPPVAEADGEEVHARGALLAAALQTGVAEAARDAATEHAKTREQFGRPIGANQAIKHACADMAVRAEAAFAQLLYAAAACADGVSDAGYQVAVAKVVAGDASIANAEANIQVQGGMGFAWEDTAHLFVKRARTWALLFGTREHHLRTVLSASAA